MIKKDEELFSSGFIFSLRQFCHLPHNSIKTRHNSSHSLLYLFKRYDRIDLIYFSH